MDLLQDKNGGAQGAGAHAAARAADAALGKRVENRGGWRPGGGRPKGSKTGGGQASAPAKAVEETPIASPEDIEFCRETAKSGLRLLSGLISARVEKAVRSIDISLEGKGLEMADQVRIDEAEIKLVSDTVAALAAKYAALTRFAPEIALAGWLASYGVRVSGAMKDIKELTVAVASIKRAKPDPTP